MSKSIGKVFGTGSYGNPNDYISDNFNNEIDEASSVGKVQQLLDNSQIVQNNSVNTQLNQQVVNNPNYISDEDLLAKMWENVKKI